MADRRKNFIEMMMPHAMEVSRITGLDPRLVIAQSAQETGWGRSAPGNNFFGIKSHGKAGGQTFGTHEYVNGKRVNINDSFRAYDSPRDSALGYAEFLQNNKRYKPLLAADGLDAELEALGASGYATDPNYAKSVGSIARGITLNSVPEQRLFNPDTAGTMEAQAFIRPSAPSITKSTEVRDMPVAEVAQAPKEGLPFPKKPTLIDAFKNHGFKEGMKNLSTAMQGDAGSAVTQLVQGLLAGGGGKSRDSGQLMPSSLGSFAQADAQRAAGAQQLMASILANRRRS